MIRQLRLASRGLISAGAALIIATSVGIATATTSAVSKGEDLAMVVTATEAGEKKIHHTVSGEGVENTGTHDSHGDSKTGNPTDNDDQVLKSHHEEGESRNGTTGYDDPQHAAASQQSDTKTHHDESGRAIHADSHDPHAAGDHQSEGDHDEPSVMSYLAHHLVDQEAYDLPWGAVNLPKIAVSAEFAEKYPALVKIKHTEYGEDAYYIPITKHMIGLVLAALLVIILVIPGMARTRRGEVPHGFGNFLEMLVVFVRDEVVYANMGSETGRKWLPLFLTAFFLILFSNLMGMVPWGTSATGNINMTGGLAITMLLSLFFAGFKEHGIKYIATFIPHGVPWPVVILLFPIEIFGLFVKHFALCIRLFANMLAGHTVIGVFLALILSPFIAIASVPGAVAISMLELFVAFLQAYIFVMLSSLFIGSAIHPSH